MLHALGRIIKFGLATFVFAMLVGALGLMALRSVNRQVYSVQTGSMAPVMSVGDVVVVNTSFSSLKKGDIISFRPEQNTSATITHRIVEIDDARGLIATKGDNSSRRDLPIRSTQVVGSVEHIAPFVGYGLDLFKNPIGLALAVYLPASVVVAGEVKRLARVYESRRYRLYNYRHHYSH